MDLTRQKLGCGAGSQALAENIQGLYERAFPEIERLPFETLLSYTKKESAELWGYFKDGEFAAFAYVLLSSACSYLLYFAVAEEARGTGIGADVVKDLMRLYSGREMILDIEPPGRGDNAPQRERRMRFYTRLGFADTHMEMRDSTGDFRVLSSNPAVFDADVLREFFGIMPPSFVGTIIVPV